MDQIAANAVHPTYRGLNRAPVHSEQFRHHCAGSHVGESDTGRQASACICAKRAQLYGHTRLLETSRRIGVWPDSVQVLGGTLSMRLPNRSRMWLSFGLQPAGHCDEVWLQRGLPCS